MNIKRWGIILVSLGLLSGCAFGDAHLDISYDKNKAISGPLSSVSSQKVIVGKFVDKRPETKMVGYKRNGFGQHTADIKPKKPVSEIIQDTVGAVFEKGGHSVGGSGNIELSGDVKTFWFDVKVGFWTVEFMGNAAVHLVVKNAADSMVIYEQDYRGAYSEESAAGFEGTWERVLNGALSKMAENISLDVDLADALKKHAQAATIHHAEM